ncbi:MAG: PD-(D/E)XK nuclease family protein [Candidatus Woesearchaeota archaeon]|nr:PD-(D/E)XK nuclease family protein [Candidatus Woesearchaeota archaeon]
MSSSLQFSRLQSPSSISTYKMCPRKYFLRYHLKIPSVEAIPTVRGKLVHSVLEDFFSLSPSELTSANCQTLLTLAVQQLLVQKWRAEPLIEKLCPAQEERFALFEETLFMLQNWVSGFVVPRLLAMSGSPADNFQHVIPLREQHFSSSVLGVQGFVDVIESHNGEVRIMDYKTSTKIDVHEHKLQLGVYALLYHQKHNQLPHKVGIYFLKNGSAQFLPVNDELVNHARLELAFVHEKTQSTDIKDYPLKPGPLCKWKTGQCDYFEYCFKGKTLPVKV